MPSAPAHDLHLGTIAVWVGRLRHDRPARKSSKGLALVSACNGIKRIDTTRDIA